MTEGDNTRVGAADIKAAEVCNNIVHQLGGLLDVADVGLEGMSISTVAESLDLLNDCLSTLDGVGVVNSDLSTALGKLNGHRLSDTTACRLLVLDGPMRATSTWFVPEPVTTATLPSRDQLAGAADILCVEVEVGCWRVVIVETSKVVVWML